MIPRTTQIAIMTLIVVALTLCVAPRLAGASKPRPCVSGRVETIYEGQTRTCVKGTWVLDAKAGTLPSKTRVKR